MTEFDGTSLVQLKEPKQMLFLKEKKEKEKKKIPISSVQKSQFGLLRSCSTSQLSSHILAF